MPRTLDTATLNRAARDYAGFFMQPDRRSKSGKVWVSGPERIKQDFFKFCYKDEFEYLLDQMRDELGKNARADLDALAKAHFRPRDDKVLAELLKEKLAITPDGDHIEGQIGSVSVGTRIVGRSAKAVKFGKRSVLVPTKEIWQIYAGEGEERAAGNIRSEVGKGNGADPLPDGTEPLPVGANVTNISAEACIAALDAIAGRLDEGSTAANIRGRTGAQPADPDASETGTLLFTLVCTATTAVSGAVDDTDGSCSATFDSITDDTSADATGTLGYCRCAATGTGADDHIDGNAGTSDEAFVFNTVSIVAGSTVSMTSAVIGQSQGSTAT